MLMSVKISKLLCLVVISLPNFCSDHVHTFFIVFIQKILYMFRC